MDLFGGNFVDLFDAPVSVPAYKSTSLDADTSEVDLFADAAFVSAPSEQEATKAPIPQVNFCVVKENKEPLHIFLYLIIELPHEFSISVSMHGRGDRPCVLFSDGSVACTLIA